jgi:CDP-diacylglycerol--serine O-phosphatidyltransferase
MIFDALDGYVARLSRSASNFGMQLDSLCDAISFGAAPAFLVLRMGPGWNSPRLHQTVSVIATLYMVCAILRLARFNVETIPDPLLNKRFKGLPSPAAAGCLASLAILRGEQRIVWGEFGQEWPFLQPAALRTTIEGLAPLGALAVALLMVSRLPYPHLTKQILKGRRPFRHLVQILLAGFVIVLVWDLALVLLFWVYAFAIPLRYLWAKGLQRTPSPLSTSGLDDLNPH